MTPAQTFSNVFGRPWPGGTSAEVVGYLRALGISDAPGSAGANLKLQNALNSGWRPGQQAAPAPAPTPAPAPPPAPQKTLDDLVEAKRQLAIKELDRFKQLFRDNDPFAYDKALAEKALQTSTEMYDPEFKRKMDEWISDIGIKMDSFDTKNKLIDELANANKGIAGGSAEAYRQAREQALQGFSGRGLLGSGIQARGQGEMEITRNKQLQGASDILLRNKQGFEDVRQTALAEGQKGSYFQGLGQKALPLLESYTKEFPSGDVAAQSQDLIKQFTPWLQNAPPSSRPYDLTRSFGL